jgi:hypothetical protein
MVPLLGVNAGCETRTSMKGNLMITMAIAIVACLCYWFEWYRLAFWILIYAVVYGILDAVRALIKTNDFSKRQ